MKRILCTVCLLLLLLSAAGCSTGDAPRVPVTFYYGRVENVSAGENSVIAGEIRDAAGYEDDLSGLIAVYLKGPVTDHLDLTFPDGLQIVSLSEGESSVELTLADTFLRLSRLDASITGAAMARTLVELTGCEDVTVRVNGKFPADNNSITVNAADILLTDSEPTAPTE